MLRFWYGKICGEMRGPVWEYTWGLRNIFLCHFDNALVLCVGDVVVHLALYVARVAQGRESECRAEDGICGRLLLAGVSLVCLETMEAWSGDWCSALVLL